MCGLTITCSLIHSLTSFFNHNHSHPTNSISKTTPKQTSHYIKRFITIHTHAHLPFLFPTMSPLHSHCSPVSRKKMPRSIQYVRLGSVVVVRCEQSRQALSCIRRVAAPSPANPPPLPSLRRSLSLTLTPLPMHPQLQKQIIQPNRAEKHTT